jgi:hypothetical protein
MSNGPMPVWMMPSVAAEPSASEKLPRRPVETFVRHSLVCT